MEIIVNNEAEAKLVKDLLTLLQEDGLEALEVDYDDKLITEEGYTFLREAVFNTPIKIDTSIAEMTLEPNSTEYSEPCNVCSRFTSLFHEDETMTYQELEGKKQRGIICIDCEQKGADNV